MEALELVPKPLKQLQTRATFVEASPVLQEVQIADELGFAYLVGDIDFGAVGRDEIFQNIRFIILTEYFSTPLDREFGFDYSMIDKPMAIAEAIFAQEVALKISLYEPRAQFRSIDYVRDEMIGKLSPSVKVALLTTQELPPSVPTGTAPAAVAGAPGAVIEEVDLPGFYETLIELARVPGPPGPVGQKGDAATIEVGTTTTGSAGTQAQVVNVGDEHSAIFDFTIPKGDKGDQGTGINIKGTVPDSASLPTTGNQPGDMWIASDTGHGWTWDGDSWVDAGPIQGPVGPQGPQGVQGPKGDAATATAGTTSTSAPGTNATVANVGTLSAAVFNFTIPRGDVGAQGTQGVQGVKGDQGNVGATGPPNVLTVQSTTTGAPGTNANVVVSGTSPAQALAFTIPRGDVGATGSQGAQGVQGPVGSQGPQGIQGIQGVNAFTTTSANFDLPVVGGSVVVTLIDASWVTIGQMVVVQTAGGAPTNAYSLKVIAKAGNQVTLQNIATTYDIGSAGTGDMLKSIYDTNSDNIVDRASLADHATDIGESTIFTYQDHFLTGSDGSYTNWTAVQGTGAAKAQTASSPDHPGVYSLTTGTQAGAAATGYGFVTAGNAYAYGTGALAFRCVFLPSAKPTSTAANLSKVFLGFGTQPVNGTFPGADFVGFVFDPSSGMANAANNWGFLTRRSSASTYTDTGFVYSASAWADFSFFVDSTGAYRRAYTWGGTAPAKSAAITSNVPFGTTLLCLIYFVLNGPSGATSYQSYIDLWEVAYKGNTVVPVFRGANLIKNF